MTASPAERAPRSASPPGACSCLALPPNWDGYPEHRARRDRRGRQPGGGLHPAGRLGRTVAGDGTLRARPGVMVRVGPEQRRRIVPGEEGIRLLALGGVPVRSALALDRDRRAVAGPAEWRSEPTSSSGMRLFAAAQRRAPALHVHCYRMLGRCDDATTHCRRRPARVAGDRSFEPRASLSRGCTRSRPTSACGCSSSARAGGARDRSRSAAIPGRAARGRPRRRPSCARASGSAYIAALQFLPPQPARRAALARRPRVVGRRRRRRRSATSVAAVNSALQRARERLKRERPRAGSRATAARASARPS